MPITTTWRNLGRFTLFCVAAAMFAQPMQAQETEHIDPVSLDDPKEWHEASMPTPYGVIGYGSIPLYGTPEVGTKYPNTLRAGLMVYYDAWQLGFEMRPEASYVRLMPRTVGRDGYVAGVVEIGFASARGEVYDWYSGDLALLDFTETRYGMGISARSGASQTLGARFLFDMTVGLAERQNAASSYYVTAQLGALLRVPLQSVVISAGPYVGLGSGMLTYEQEPPVVEVDAGYLRAGLHLEVALNLNRPQYLTGAQ